MKQIIAIIRDERVEETKTALEKTGVLGVTFLYVTGRGQQKGVVHAREPGSGLNRNLRMPMESPGAAHGSANPGEEIPFNFFSPEKRVCIRVFTQAYARYHCLR
jgi:Nitrogen regulatory protein P-II